LQGGLDARADGLLDVVGEESVARVPGREVFERAERAAGFGDIQLLEQGLLQRGLDFDLDWRIGVAVEVLLDGGDIAGTPRVAQLRPRQEQRAHVGVAPAALEVSPVSLGVVGAPRRGVQAAFTQMVANEERRAAQEHPQK
jgi:hypothetical protein